MNQPTNTPYSLLQNAKILHKDLRKQRWTDDLIGVILEPKKYLVSPRQITEHRIKEVDKISEPDIKILCEIFPDTMPEYWEGKTDWNGCLDALFQNYKASDFEANTDLVLLMNLIQERKYCKTLFNKYL